MATAIVAGPSCRIVVRAKRVFRLARDVGRGISVIWDCALGVRGLRSGGGSMSVYDEFAKIYSDGDYSAFSRGMGEHLPAALRALGVSPTTILDLACGEGTFAVAASRLGYRVTGLDASEQMLTFAQEQTRSAEADVSFVRADMRALPFSGGFDLVTCWYDSLNYILDPQDLLTVFKGVAVSLRGGGLFLFDMNTVYGLAVNWRENPCYVQADTGMVFEVHRQDYDFETGTACMHITGFLRNEDNTWRRIDEEHRERAYSQKEVCELLDCSGFQLLASWGSFRDRSVPTSESPRVWYAAKSKIA